jgi:GntR family transcriptional regulator
MDRLDKSIPTPLYYQLLNILKEKIENGVWGLGETIPTEQELMKQYDISRSTTRQAIMALVNEGYLHREKSKGTIVSSRTSRMGFLGGLLGFTEEMESKKIPHSSQILAQQVLPATEPVAEKFSIPPGSQVYYLKRVRNMNDRPFLIDEHYIPYNLCPGIEQKYRENTSLYRLLKDEYQFNLHYGQIEFEAMMPSTKEVMDFLRVQASTCLLFVSRVVYSDQNIPLDFFTAIIHGKFTLDVKSTPKNGS